VSLLPSVDHLLLHCDVSYALWTNIFNLLVCLGLCVEELLICLPVDGSLEGRGVLQFERWCLFPFFGVFGRKEISDVSRI
jgi:hypothetical protein